jgi:hypothetical protein
MRALLLASCTALLAACSSTTPSDAADPLAADGGGPGATDRAESERSFEPGPAISEREPLVAWLAMHAREGGSGATLRLPVALALRDGGTHLGDAYLGLEGGAERLVVLLDDSALGIALLDRVRQHARSDGSCALWLEGVWLGSTRSGGSFAVHAVRGAIGAAGREAAARVYVATEAKSG